MGFACRSPDGGDAATGNSIGGRVIPHPSVVRASTSAQHLGLTDPPVYNAISRLEEAGILREVTGRTRGKVYVYDEYLSLLTEGTEPLPARSLE